MKRIGGNPNHPKTGITQFLVTMHLIQGGPLRIQTINSLILSLPVILNHQRILRIEEVGTPEWGATHITDSRLQVRSGEAGEPHSHPQH